MSVRCRLLGTNMSPITNHYLPVKIRCLTRSRDICQASNFQLFGAHPRIYLFSTTTLTTATLNDSDMGRHGDRSEHFLYLIDNSFAKSEAAQCKHCRKPPFAKHATREKAHLETCSAYQSSLASDRKRTLSGNTPNHFGLMSHKRHEDINEAAAHMIYETGLPFTWFERPAVKAWLQKLQPAWTLPGETLFRTTYLDNEYIKVKSEIDNIIDQDRNLAITIDDTSNVYQNHISNILVATDKGTFYYHNAIINGDTQTVEISTQSLLESCRTISRNQLQQINAISMDTCSHNLNMQNRIRQLPELQHSIILNCDAHGIALLLKDLIELKEYTPTVGQAMEILNHFAHSPKQKAILKEKCEQLHVATPIIRSPSETYWGSHVDSFESLVQNKHALLATLTDARTDFTSSSRAKSVARTLSDTTFWGELEELLSLILPLRGYIHQAEASTAHVGLVRSRWDKIKEHIQRWRQTTAKQLVDLDNTVYKRRMRQLSDIHELAHILMPATINARYEFAAGVQTQLLTLLRQYIPHREEYDKAVAALMNYVTRMEGFDMTDDRWEYHDRPIQFWQRHADDSYELAVFAHRLFKTVANSASCERAFSRMKLVHSKNRNRLSPERVNKLLFISINSPVLRRDGPGRITALIDSDEDAEDDEYELTVAPLVVQQQIAMQAVPEPPATTPEEVPPGARQQMRITSMLGPNAP